MKRLHVHLSVDNLLESIHFYSVLFAAEPTVNKPDYAKWMLDDPRVNFAISRRGAAIGLNHLGIQVESADELADMRARLPNPTNTGRTTRRASPGKLSIRWTAFRFLAGTRRKKPPAAYRQQSDPTPRGAS